MNNANNIMKQLPREQRPYEKCFMQGEGSLNDTELLAVILRSGGSVHHPKLTQTPKEVPTEEQLKKQKKLTEAAEKAASDASVQAGEATGLMQRCREELTEGVKGYIAQFLPEEKAEEILRNEAADPESAGVRQVRHQSGRRT